MGRACTCLCTESYLPQRFWREGWSFKKTLQKVIRYKYHNLN